MDDLERSELLALRDEVQRLRSRKDEFLAIISHELRTPLAAISLWANALRAGAVAPENVARAVDAIATSAEEQSQLIESLLDLSRLGSGRTTLALGPVDVCGLIQSAIHVIEPAALTRAMTLSNECDVPARPALLDSTRVKQILWNILGNAMKFTPDGGVVTIRTHVRRETLEIEVTDTGEGIAPEFLPFVFDKFRQADMATTQSRTGLGIGLAVAKQLVELHGGNITARSEGRDRGATFVVRLPWRDAVEAGA